MSGQKPREIAARVLRQRKGGEYTETLLEKALANARLSSADHALCQALTYGVVRWQETLDWLIARKTDGRPQKPDLQNILRLGLFQIFWMDRIPGYAAVDESVELARSAGFSAQSGFVNAILRNYLREFDTTRKLLDDLKLSRPAIGYSHPEWLVDRWTKGVGSENAIRLMEWNNKPPATFARINTLKTDAPSLTDQWRREEVDFEAVERDWLEENLMFELKSHPPLASLPSFQQGLFYIQDPSTTLAVSELDPQPGETVLDLCAAPGGKLTHAAQRMNNQGRIVAIDTSEDRLKLIAENCARLGVTIVEALLPSTINHQPSTKYDRILVDAPCSNTGVMRRRVDLRWRIRLEEIERLRRAQIDLLQLAASLLNPGGRLVYSTCSLEREENESVVQAFLTQRPGVTLHRQLDLEPFKSAMDGAYVAALTRTSK